MTAGKRDHASPLMRRKAACRLNAHRSFFMTAGMTSFPGMVRPVLETSLGQSCLASIACLLAGGAWWWFSHPVFALAVGLAPFAILAALRQPFLMVLGFLIFSFFRIHEVFPALYPLHIPQFLAFATLGALAWNLFTRRIEMFWSRELTAFAIFFMLVSIGVALATNRAEALDGYTGTFVKIAVMTVAMSWLVTGHKEFRLAARFIVLAGITVGLVAIYNQLNGIGLIEGTRVTIGRDIGSMLGDPNDLALVLLFPASFTLGLMMSPGIRWYEKLFGAAAFVIILMAVIATQSRGGLLGIAAVIGVFAYRRIRSKTLVVIIGVTAVAALFIIADISGRESGGAVEEGMGESAMGRIYAWEAAFSMALANPLTGVGIKNFLPNYFFYSNYWDGRNHAVHSTWFGVLAETGFLGLSVYLAMIVATLKSVLASLRLLVPDAMPGNKYQPHAYAMGQAVLAGLVGFLVSGTFLTMGFTWPVYTLLALAVGVSRYAMTQINTQNEKAPSERSARA